MARYGAMRHHHLPPVHAVAQEIRHGQYQKKINYFQQKRRSKTILEQVYGRTVITVIPGNMNIVYPSLTHLVHKVFVLIRLGQRREYNFGLFCPVLFGWGTPYFFLF
jgi:hypothetical protein